jgi:hypothetical protein
MNNQINKEKANESNPSIHDLNDWALFNEEELFNATKYLSESSRYDILKTIWEAKGKPDLSQIW